MSDHQESPKRRLRPGELLASKVYEIDVEEPAKDVFRITLANEASRRVLRLGQEADRQNEVTVLVGYLDTTLDIIGEEVTGMYYPWSRPPGITGQNDGTPHRFDVQINDPRKRELIKQCAKISGVEEHEAVRRLTAAALGLVIFENGDPEEPKLHPMLTGETSTTVH